VRRSRERFWAPWQTPQKNGPRDIEKWSAYLTLYECLLTVAQLAAPFTPFQSEEIYQALHREPLGDSVPESVHLCDYPEADETLIDTGLATEIELVREAASLGRAARSGAKLKTRQPLAKVVIVLAKAEQEAIVRRHEAVLLDELNVKLIEVAPRADDYVTYEVKPNFKAIGAKFRESVPLIKDALSKSDAAALRAQFAAQGQALIKLANGQEVALTTAEIEVTLKAKDGFAAASGSHIVAVLDTQLTPELLDEGVAREIVNRVNGWRSDLKLAYEQRIKLAISGGKKLDAIARKFKDYIARETLTVELVTGTIPAGYTTLSEKIDDEAVELGMALAE
jgi:isoleucyl-tRNA synthetase